MSHRKTLLLLSCLSLVFILIAAGCKENEHPVLTPKLAAEYPAEASLSWNKLFLRIERYAAGYRPCPAPNALGYLGLASYEACVSAMPEYNSLESHFPGLNIPNVEPESEYHWPTVVHAVYETMMPKFFTQEFPVDVKAEWDALILQLDTKYLAETGAEIFNRSKEYGESVGNAVWEWSTTDPYAYEAYKDPFGNYTTNESYDWSLHYDGPGDWEPTLPGPVSPIFPFFGKARTFSLAEEDKLSLPPSYYSMQYSADPHSEYYAEALHVYTSCATSGYDAEWIRDFWNDEFLGLTFSYGSRWISITNQIVDKDAVPLDKALEAYAKTGMALNDAAVACFKSKYEYNIERPVTYINKMIDPNFRPCLQNPLSGETGLTPPYPTYPSGRSTFGSAAAETLASIFGYSYGMTDNSHLGRTEFKSGPRTFTSLHDMALENAWSQTLYGTNWYMDSIEGIRLGTVIGQKVDALPWKK